jgi:hypothetical protein
MGAVTWTTPEDIKAEVQRLWDRGLLLASLAGDEQVFPRRFPCRGPDSAELSGRFPEVRDWIARLSAAAGAYRLEWRTVNHRVLGANQMPAAIWVDTLEDALSLIGKRRAVGQFSALVDLTRERQPALVPWLAQRPLRALELAEHWPQLLAVVAWLQAHPRPGIYLRQVDLPGVHTKLIEGHRGVLAELLDLMLPAGAINTTHAGVGGFCGRYGFLDKPLRVRFRILDPRMQLLLTPTARDITLTQEAFAAIEMPGSKVFITENEVNFLAFPDVPGAIVIFGAGYGFENLAAAKWLLGKDLYYWGDIDTHGFAILNQLRRTLPQAVSMLMDEQTLLDHQALWGTEERPESAELALLKGEEREVYDGLRQGRWGERVRLEQERVGFERVVDVLGRLP